MNALLLHLDARAATTHRSGSNAKSTTPAPASGLDDFDSALKAAAKGQHPSSASSDASKPADTPPLAGQPVKAKTRAERSPSRSRNSRPSESTNTIPDHNSADETAHEPVAQSSDPGEADAADPHDATGDDSSGQPASDTSSANTSAVLPPAGAVAQAANANASPVHVLPGVNVAAGIAQSLHLSHIAQQEAGQQAGAQAGGNATTAPTGASQNSPPQALATAAGTASAPTGEPAPPANSKTANPPPSHTTASSGNDPSYPLQLQHAREEAGPIPLPPGMTQPLQPAGRNPASPHADGGAVVLRGADTQSPATDAASAGQQQLAQAIATAVSASSAGSTAGGGAEGFSDAEGPEGTRKADAASLLATSAQPAPAPAAAGAESASPAQDSPAPEAQNTFDQIVMGLRGKLDAKSGRADIRLEPPNLGTVRVSVSLENGALTAQFQSSSDAVRNLLKDNMEKLKSVLQNQGVAVDKLAVDSPDAATAAASPQQQPGQQNSFGSASHDGRSAGEYRQEPRHRRSSEGESFARALKASADKVDLVA